MYSYVVADCADQVSRLEIGTEFQRLFKMHFMSGAANYVDTKASRWSQRTETLSRIHPRFKQPVVVSYVHSYNFTSTN